MEDHCTLPALQDLLEQIDPKGLEELAENLLENVTADFESNASTSNTSIASIESTTKSMFGSLVGTETEDMESSENRNESVVMKFELNNTSIKQEIIDYTLPNDLFSCDTIENSMHNNSQDNENIIETNNDSIDVDNTVYGTYDEQKHCITIISSNDEITNYDEIIEEVVSDDDGEYLSPTIINKSKLSTIDDGFKKSPLSNYERDSAYDSVADISSPNHSISSDDFGWAEPWPEPFVELFPSLA